MSLSGEYSRIISALKELIIQRRSIIRHHRDQRLDDRCWLDDYLVWAMCADSSAQPSLPPTFDEAMRKCHQFYKCRRAESPDPTSVKAILDTGQWDDDLKAMTGGELIDELTRIQQAIRCHRDIKNRPRSTNDDRLLYSILPEKIPADFQLPPEDEFLGELKSPHAGCPAFWRSHANCLVTRHNFHQWGPCPHQA
ncbi:MAG: hypothetical protein AAB972_03285 [Patescibacteria group bacterium]